MHHEFWITILVTIIIGLAPIYFQHRSKPRRSFVCSVISYTQQYTPSAKQPSELKFLVNGKEATTLSLVILEFRNTGSETIKLPKSDDYETNLTIGFQNDPPIFDGRVVGRSHESLTISTTLQEDRIIVGPTLLNPGSWFQIALWIGTNAHCDVKLGYQIEGLSHIPVKNNTDSFITRTRKEFGTSYADTMWGYFLGGSMSAWIFSQPEDRWSHIITVIIGSSLPLVVYLIFRQLTSRIRALTRRV